MDRPLIPKGHLFSQHSLTTFRRCPRRFLLKYIDRQPWPVPDSDDPLDSGAHLERGRIFHLWMVRRHLGLPMEDIVACCEDAQLVRWWATAESFPWRGLPTGMREAELPVVVPLGEYRLYARYDLVALDPGGEAIIVDYKTLRQRPREETLQNRLQTRIYLYSLVAAGRVLTGGAEVDPEHTTMLYWFTDFPERPGIVRYSRQAFEQDREMLTSLARRAGGLLREEFRPCDDPRQCTYCTYRSLCDEEARAAASESVEALDWLDEELDALLDGQGDEGDPLTL